MLRQTHLHSLPHLREIVWQKLKQLYAQYPHPLTIQQFESLLRSTLTSLSPRQTTYLLNNLCKIDTDPDGSIQFHQFANFLLKRYCGELTLQKLHYTNQLQQKRRVNLKEFTVLLNSAFEFLHITVSQLQGQTVFNKIDADGDGWITYVEYFGFVDKDMCEYRDRRQERGSQGQVRSRLRTFVWEELRKVYDHYDRSKSNRLDAQEIEKIIQHFLKDISKEDIDYILFKVLRVSASQQVQFPEFAAFILKYVIELHLSQFYRLHGSKKHKINRQDFLVIIKTAFSFLPISRVSTTLFFRFFDKIDSDNDGWISCKQLITWVQVFLCPATLYGTQFYVQQDDENLTLGRSSIHPAETVAPRSDHPKPTLPQTTSHLRISPIRFSSHQLALRVRKQVLFLISKYDQNNNKLFEQDEISQMLQQLLKETKNQIKYVLMNVFRYDKDGDKKITYDEIADFLLEMHSGEMAIQRLHLNERYKRGRDRVMDLGEFVETMKDALGYFQMGADQATLRILFIEIDRDGDGWVTYQEYFQFLRYYFGSQSEAAKTGLDKYEQAFAREAHLIQESESLSYEERLRRIFKLQMEFHVFKYDTNHNRMLEQDEIISLLTSNFGYKQSQLTQLLKPLFIKSPSVNFDVLWTLMTTTHLSYTLPNFLSKYKLSRQKEELINFEQFSKLVEFSFGYSLTVPKRDQLQVAFNSIDTDNDGWIHFSSWIEYLQKLFGVKVHDKSLGDTKVSGINSRKNGGNTDLEGQIKSEVWKQLKKLYDFYDSSKSDNMNRQGLQQFCKQIIHQTQQKDLSYVFISLLSGSKSNPPTVPFQQFASFIINYAIQTSLKRFHFNQTPGKERLSKQEFVQVVQTAYSFLKDKTQTLEKIFQKLDRGSNGQVAYTELMSWVYFDLAKRNK